MAAAHSVDWGDEVELDLAHLPELDQGQRLQLWQAGLAVTADGESKPICTKANVDAQADLDLLAELGFAPDDETDTAAWMAAADAPPVSDLVDGYRLGSRADDASRPHHLIARNGPFVEERLRQTELYRPDLDLVVHDADGDVAGYGLFWFDPRTATGLVEPMRTEEQHQRRGIARSVLTTGIARLAELGATRIKISYEDANPASGALYRDVGFVPTTRHRYYVRPAAAGFG